MLGKLIARGPTREAARERLVQALRGLAVLGLPTNRGFLLACLQDEAFVAGRAAVPFLEEAGARLRRGARRGRAGRSRGAGVRPSSEKAGGAARAALPPPGRGRCAGATAGNCTKPSCEGGERARGAEPLSVNGQALQLAVLPPHGEHAGAPRRWHLQWAGVDWVQDDASFEPPAAEAPAAGGRRARVARALRRPRCRAWPCSRARSSRPGSTAVVIESMKLEHALGPAGPRRVGRGCRRS
jgi:3-methylcrotonyl-CoA carboxylase alpha subunit/geranyl-CoA carboxylase alpha subunit